MGFSSLLPEADKENLILYTDIIQKNSFVFSIPYAEAESSESINYPPDLSNLKQMKT